MKPSFKMIAVGLVAFGLGFLAASRLARESATGLLAEPDGARIQLTATAQDEAYLVLESVEPAAAGEADATRMRVVGPTAVTTGRETLIYKLEPLMWCGDGHCQPCTTRPVDDCPVPPAPPIPFLQDGTILVHQDHRIR